LGTVKTTGKLEADNSFNGRSNISLLSPSSTLAVGRADTVSFTLNVVPNKNFGTFNNTATATAVSDDGQTTSDVSTVGTNPDPDRDGLPTEQAVTPVILRGITVYIPGGFSPNNDGINDKFTLENASGERISLEVYNRWGNMVYKNNDYKNEWEGFANQGVRTNDPLPDGTYYYIVLLNGKSKFTGFITIKR
jgi:gliding motility-associated-like protein